jgi:hypothetical protein
MAGASIQVRVLDVLLTSVTTPCFAKMIMLVERRAALSVE